MFVCGLHGDENMKHIQQNLYLALNYNLLSSQPVTFENLNIETHFYWSLYVGKSKLAEFQQRCNERELQKQQI